MMDKYGVKTNSGDTKTASQGCPSCGGDVASHGQVLVCENCGTKPFENKENKSN